MKFGTITTAGIVAAYIGMNLCILRSQVAIAAADPLDIIVASTMILEAGGEKSPDAMKAVYEVIRNRSITRDLSLVEVCFQRKQFSCWNDIEKRPDLLRRALRHRKFARALIVVQEDVKTNLTKGATHYHSWRVNPYWAPTMTKTAIIDNHIFYRTK